MTPEEAAARIKYLEECLRVAGYWESDYGWLNGVTFIALDAVQHWSSYRPRASTREEWLRARSGD